MRMMNQSKEKETQVHVASPRKEFGSLILRGYDSSTLHGHMSPTYTHISISSPRAKRHIYNVFNPDIPSFHFLHPLTPESSSFQPFLPKISTRSREECGRYEADDGSKEGGRKEGRKEIGPNEARRGDLRTAQLSR
jgi:hypothetical protein